MTEPTRKKVLSILSAEFVIATLIQFALFFFVGMKAVGALDNRVTALEVQAVDPRAVATLEESVRGLTKTVDELKVVMKEEAQERRNRRLRIDPSP